MTRTLLFLLLLAPLAASAQTDGRISFLEQEVRNLQRQVQALSRQIDEMRTRPGQPPQKNAAASGGAPAASSTDWVDAAKWQKLRRGMSELEVISALGAPTSMREEGGARVLLYAMEIGDSGFLGGSVTIRDRAVIEVRAPTLQ
jgi:hypothetical protein